MLSKLTRRGLLAGTAALAASGTAISLLPYAGRAGATGRAPRRNHALLVAVTEYPELPQRAWLVGPNNDAVLMHDYLASLEEVPFAREDIRVLADKLETAGLPSGHIEVAGSPTLAAIRGELDALAGRVSEGDFVYLHFCGHGAQQIAIDPSTEPDGMDEVFLPADTGRYDRDLRANPNAFRDFQIGEHLQRIRDRGAFVWAVFDCCHSGTMTRAIDLEDEVERKVELEDLGIPAEDIAAAVAAAASAHGATRGTDGGGIAEPRQAMFDVHELAGEQSRSAAGGEARPGGMVAFFAAQTVETTPELPLPRGADDAQRLGLFSYTLFSKLSENPNVTYRQLGQGILQEYTSTNRTRPTPLFEGDLDTPVFGTEFSGHVAQWPIRVQGGTIEVPAGTIHRLTVGSKLAIVPLAGSPDADTVGYLEVAQATNLTSRLRPVAHGDLPAPTLGDIPANAYARLAVMAVDFEMRVARPAAIGAHHASVAAVNAALSRIAEDRTLPMNISLVPAGASADISLMVMSEQDAQSRAAPLKGEDAGVGAQARLSEGPRLWLLPPSYEVSLAEGRRAPSIVLPAQPEPVGGVPGRDQPAAEAELDDEAARALSDSLLNIFRAVSLARLSAASDFRDDDFEVRFRIVRRPSGEEEVLDAGTVPVVHPDDEVHLTARNGTRQPVDINILYIGSDYSISHMAVERLHPNAQLDLGLLYFTPDSFGIERMVAVLTEADPQSITQDLSFLAQDGIKERTMTRAIGDEPDGFLDHLTDLGMSPPTRAAASLTSRQQGSRGALLVFPVENTPRAS